MRILQITTFVIIITSILQITSRYVTLQYSAKLQVDINFGFYSITRKQLQIASKLILSKHKS